MAEMTVDFPMMITMMVTLLLLMAVGYASRKLGFIDDKSSKWLSNFVICVCQPFMIIDAVISIDFSVENLKMASLATAAEIAWTAIPISMTMPAILRFSTEKSIEITASMIMNG